MGMNSMAMALGLFELFLLGVMIGFMGGERHDPNAPKPKNWEDKLHKRWMDGFKAGEKSMAKRMSKRLKREEATRLMREDSNERAWEKEKQEVE